MNQPTSETDKQLRDTPRVNLVVAYQMNKGKRNACLVLGVIALVVSLLVAWEFGWSKWLLLLPATLGIGAFLYQMNMLIVSSELRRHSKEPEELEERETPRRPTPEEAIEECNRRCEFMESHQEEIVKRAAEYMIEHPDESPEDVIDLVTEKCFLEHEIAELKAQIAGVKAETAQLSEAEEVDEPRWRLELQGQDRIVFGCVVAFWAGIAGVIVGVLWALALSGSLIFGAILGACINAVFWVLACSAAAASGEITPKEAVFVMGSVMPLLCGLLTIVALVVWVIRLLL